MLPVQHEGVRSWWGCSTPPLDVSCLTFLRLTAHQFSVIRPETWSDGVVSAEGDSTAFRAFVLRSNWESDAVCTRFGPSDLARE